MGFGFPTTRADRGPTPFANGNSSATAQRAKLTLGNPLHTCPTTGRFGRPPRTLSTFLPVKFTSQQIQTIAQGFANYVEKSGVTFWAVAVLDDHLHAVFMRHRYKSEQVNNLLKDELTKALIDAGQHPFANETAPGDRPPPCFGRRWWTVYIDNLKHLVQAIRYVEDNPAKEGKPRQKWDFVVPHPLTLAEWRQKPVYRQSDN